MRAFLLGIISLADTFAEPGHFTFRALAGRRSQRTMGTTFFFAGQLVFPQGMKKLWLRIGSPKGCPEVFEGGNR
jgi:hypothetical protein